MAYRSILIALDGEPECKARTAVALALARRMQSHLDRVRVLAFGHSRWAERLPGGTTRALLASMTVPVLMSH